jgi:phosphatidylglycerophosphatase A
VADTEPLPPAPASGPVEEAAPLPLSSAPASAPVEPAEKEEEDRPPRTVEAWLIATFFGVGFLPLMPGTWGSLATVLLWALAARFIRPELHFMVALLVACAAIIVGIPAASIVCRETGRDDPQIVVIDEVAGQMLTLLLVPLGWKAFLVGFILFRVFDTWKPFPLRRLEKLPEGSGVVMDDVGAGFYGFLVMQLLLYFHVL